MSHPYLNGFDQDEFPIDSNLSYEQIEQHLSAVTSFWAAGKLEELVSYVKKLINQQIYDIRLMSFYFYSLWEVDAFDCSLDQILEALQNLIKQPEAVWLLKEESEKRDDESTDELDEPSKKQLKASLNLFFNRVGQKLERFADQEETEEPFPCEIIKHADAFSAFIEQTFQFGDMTPLVQQISSHFSDACQKEMEEAELEAMHEAEDAIDETDIEVLDQIDDPFNEIADETQAMQRLDEPTIQTSQSEMITQEHAVQKPKTQYSVPMQQLLNKIQIFEILMSNTDVYKAAIVFESIQKELEQFNPLHYLPELFSSYAKTHALYAADLYQLMLQHDNPQSQALKDYFAIDPDGFLQLELGEMDNHAHDDLMGQEEDYPYAFHGE